MQRRALELLLRRESPNLSVDEKGLGAMYLWAISSRSRISSTSSRNSGGAFGLCHNIRLGGLAENKICHRSGIAHKFLSMMGDISCYPVLKYGDYDPNGTC